MNNKTKNQITVGLIGNPNTGKTSLINSLAGLNLHVGNWPGKTVEKTEGLVNFANHKIKIVDLPGTYSIAPYSEEEKISRDFILKGNTDIIIQIIDVNTLERNLLMTFELLSLRKKLILAFNFNKEAEKRGIKINVKEIKKRLQIPIIQIEAHTGENKEELLKAIVQATKDKIKVPDYINSLVKTREEIDHQAALKFIKENIKPFYRTQDVRQITQKLDSFVLSKYLALPIFFLVIFAMFKITFTVSQPFVTAINTLLSWLITLIGSFGLPEILASFLIEGVIGGVGSILSFTPLIFILFVIIALLEDSGYLARTVVLVDYLFSKVGISGRTFIPMILGFGCNVPAIMATRTIRNKKEKLIAIFINPFISCSARLPTYVLFTSIFFPKNASLIIMILYVFGVLTALIASLILSKIIQASEKNTLMIELPPYRLPSPGIVLKHAWYQGSLFVKKAGTIIFVLVIIIWLLASFPLGVEYGSGESFLGKLGHFLTPIFKPLGFSHWTFSVALLFGFIAKEVVVGTLGTLHGVNEGKLTAILPQYISPLGALSFLFFVLLYVPCLATISVIKKETNSWKFTLIQVIVSLILAWLIAFLVYNLGNYFTFL